MPRLKLENFYVRSSIFSALSLGAAFINYALYPALTRVLSTREFGDFTAILALSNQLLGILLAFNLTSIYLVKKYPEQEAREKAQIIQKVLIWFFVASTLLLALCSPFIKQWLHIANPLSFVVLAALLVTAVPAVTWTGYLQGHKQLVKVGVFNFVSSFLRLIFAVVFSSIWGASGGLWGVLTGVILGIATLRLVAGVRLPSIASTLTALSKSQRAFVHNMRLYIVGSVLIVGMLSVLQNIDIVYAKVLFSPEAAGVYSGVSILSNALYFVSFLLIWILLPEVDIDQPKHNRRLLKTAYSLIILMAASTVTIEILSRSVITHVLLGAAFDGQGSLLIFATLFQLTLVAITLYAYYLLVLRDKRALLLGVCAFVPTVALPLIVIPRTTQSMITTLLLSILSGGVIYVIINTMLGAFAHASKRPTN